MPNTLLAAPTFESQLNDFIEKISPFVSGLEIQWKKTDVLALFEAKNIFKKFNDINQAIIESLIDVSAATIVAFFLTAITSIISKILFAISLALFVKATFDAYKNNDVSAVEMGLYGAGSLLLSYLVNIASPILAISTLALLVYKSSDLIKKSLPDEFKDTWTSRAQSLFTIINQKIDDTQAYVKTQFGMNKF